MLLGILKNNMLEKILEYETKIFCTLKYRLCCSIMKLFSSRGIIISPFAYRIFCLSRTTGIPSLRPIQWDFLLDLTHSNNKTYLFPFILGNIFLSFVWNIKCITIIMMVIIWKHEEKTPSMCCTHKIYLNHIVS